jgi:glycosyltransferase involved in cell wall biosynthesis
MRRIPTVISMDATPANIDDLGVAYRHKRGGNAVELFKRQVNRHAFSAARAMVTWSSWAADSLERDYGVARGKIRVVHPGVDLAMFRPPERRPATSKPRILFVGGDFTRKGGFDLLEAVRAIQGTVEVDIVSPSAPGAPAGEYRVHAGLAPQSSALLELFRRADIFVLPTHGDCFGLAIAEAMATGLPVIATDVGGISEMVSSGANGYLVPPHRPGELALALRTLVADAALRDRMGKDSLLRARKVLDAARNNRAIFQLMADLAGFRQAVPA